MSGAEAFLPYAAAALMAGGTAAQVSATKHSLKQKNAIIAQGAADQARRQQDVNQANLAVAKIYNPESRGQAFADQATQSGNTLTDFLSQYHAQNPGEVASGNVSKDYVTGRAKTDSDLAKRAANLVTLMSKVSAPGFVGQKEAVASANAAEFGRGAEAANLAETRGTQAAIDTLAPNPNAMIIGNLASQMGTAYLGNYLGEKARVKASTPKPPSLPGDPAGMFGG